MDTTFEKVTDPAKRVTDVVLLRHLAKHGLDPEYVEFHEDYSKEHPTTKLYRCLRTGTKFAVVSALPMVNRVGIRCLAKWLPNGDGGYSNGPNTLACHVRPDGTTEIAEDKEEPRTATWKPTLLLNGKEISPSAPILLAVDPENENYAQNTLEWDYGVCKRHLRLIEGAMLELWIFPSDPGGDVEIVSNVEGDLPAARRYAVDARDRSVVGFVVTETRKTIATEAWKGLSYPVTIDDSYLGYSTASDGRIYKEDSDYPTLWNASTGDVIAIGAYAGLGQDIAGTYDIWRALVFFVTNLGAGAQVSAGTLSLYGQEDHTDAADFLITIQNGQPTYPHDPLVAGDYLRTQYAGDGGSLTTVGFTLSGYNDIALNSTGRSWINLTGTTKLCLRSSREIAGTTPTGLEYVSVKMSESGEGYKPKLTLTYSFKLEGLFAVIRGQRRNLKRIR